MDPDRWRQIDELIDDALEVPESEREAFLDARCNGDDDLRSEVSSLLRVQDDATNFLENSAIRVAAKGIAAAAKESKHPDLIGKTIGVYQVEKLVGAGGMGEVYLAHDSRLDRKIALKILPGEFSSDDERIRRFDGEARAVSALNHPNIVTIYDVGTSSEGISYIAAEFVEGQTLRELMPTGVGLRDVFSIVIQICDALAAAHGHGIIHRDIKPENIMLRPDGYVKILDFGLAKLTRADIAQDLAKTAEGVIIGTPAYMSPGQVAGEAVDHRSDLWSVGVVLYELLTGKNPFKGENRHTTLRSVLAADPAPATSLDPALPHALDDILAKALEKDPDLGYQTASDLCADLKRVRREVDSSPSWSASAAGLSAVRRRSTRKKYFAFTAAGVLLAVLAGVAWIFYPRGVQTMAGPPNWASARSIQLTDAVGLEGFPSLSPDGKSFVYFGMNGKNTDIFWQRIGGRNTTNLTKDSPANETMPAFSPDGKLIAFRSDREQAGIYIMEETGENTHRVSDTGYHPSWSPDGRRIAASAKGASVHTFHAIPNSTLFVIDIASGEKRALDTKGDAIQPAWSPNGHRIAYWFLTEGNLGDIATIPSDGGDPVVIAESEATDWAPVWSPDGKYLYFSSDRGGTMNVWRVAVDEKTGRAMGGPESVATPSKYCRHVTFSRDGHMMAYSSYDGSSNLQTVPFDPKTGRVDGELTWVTSGDREVSSTHLSPDGGLYVARTVNRTQEDLMVFAHDGSAPFKLTDDRFLERRPRWSPDGRRIAFQSNRSGKYQIWMINPDGSHLEQVTFVDSEGAISPAWSPTGDRLVYTQIRGNHRFPAILDVGRKWGGQTPQTVPSPADLGGSFEAHTWSGDGDKLIGVFKDDKERSVGVGFYSFSSGEYRKVAASGFYPVWMNDGRRFVFSDAENLKIFLGDTRDSSVTELYSAPGGAGIQHVDISPDNKMLYFRFFQVGSDIWLLDASS